MDESVKKPLDLIIKKLDRNEKTYYYGYIHTAIIQKNEIVGVISGISKSDLKDYLISKGVYVIGEPTPEELKEIKSEFNFFEIKGKKKWF